MKRPHGWEFAVICPLFPLTECFIFLFKPQHSTAIFADKLLSYASPLWLTGNKFTSNNPCIVFKPHFLMTLHRACVSLFGVTHLWGEGKWAIPLPPPPPPPPLCWTVTYKNSCTRSVRGCFLLGVITRPFLLVPFLGRLIFVRKINAVALRLWRSEGDGLEQMRGGAG